MLTYKGYTDLKYKPKRNDLVVEFRVEPSRGVSFSTIAGALAGESSVGTWTEIKKLGIAKKIRPTVFYKNSRKKIVKIAYPDLLFEAGNISQILSSIEGNIYGMKIAKHLRLNDFDFPKSIIKKFKGPKLGLGDLRRYTKVKKRPILGTIYKPKLGLSAKQQAKQAYLAYSSGLDFSKDDENLCSMKFNPFKERVRLMLDVVDRIKDETGRKVIYVPNISSPFDQMVDRAEYVKSHGGRGVMIDILTVGWSGLQGFNNIKKFKFFIHAHRASHGMITRDPEQGVSMLSIAKLARLAGVTSLHTGTVVGKMEGSKKEVLEIDKFLRSMTDRWQGIKKVMPTASGGLHPGMLPKLVRMLGKDLVVTMGGGLWGHPLGGEAGARAIKQAGEALETGVSLKEYSKKHMELHVALKEWGVLH